MGSQQIPCILIEFVTLLNMATAFDGLQCNQYAIHIVFGTVRWRAIKRPTHCCLTTVLDTTPAFEQRLEFN